MAENKGINVEYTSDVHYDLDEITDGSRTNGKMEMIVEVKENDSSATAEGNLLMTKEQPRRGLSRKDIQKILFKK